MKTTQVYSSNDAKIGLYSNFIVCTNINDDNSDYTEIAHSQFSSIALLWIVTILIMKL